MKIFVYGTLRKGERNDHYLIGATCIHEQAWIYGGLYDTTKGFPVMKKSDKERIYGEVYEVSEEQLAMIDELEGYKEDGVNNLYDRIMVDAYNDNEDQIKVITYFAGNSLANSTASVPFGDWKVYTYLNKEKLLYFAYGSCMDDERFKLANVKEHFSNVLGMGILDKHTMLFSRSTADGGKADIVETPSEQMEGIVYHIPPAAIDYLYEREGVYTNSYRPAIVTITLNGQSFEALTFIGLKKEQESAPTKRYANEIIRGAEGMLSKDYINKLRGQINNLMKLGRRY